MLSKLCEALGFAYTDAMLSWPAGRRDTDGVWAPAWYSAVEQSTCFEAPAASSADEVLLPDHLRRIADAAREPYEILPRAQVALSGYATIASARCRNQNAATEPIP